MSALFAVDSSLELSESFSLLLLKANCLRHLGRLEESLILLDKIIDSLGKEQPIEKIQLETIQSISEMRSWIIERLVSEESEVTDSLTQDSTEANESAVEDQFWMHTTCDLREDSRTGRHFVANQFVPKGTVLMIENPINFRLYDRTTNCSNCAKPLDNSFWPCIGCIEVAFCDRECWLTAYNSHHKHECGFVDSFQSSNDLELDNEFEIVFRIISKVGVGRALDLMRNKNESALKEYAFLKSEERNVETIFRAFCCLTENDGKSLSPEEELIYNCRAIETAFLLDSTNQLDFDAEQDLELFIELADICLKIAVKLRFNGLNEEGVESKFATIVNVMASLFNHSCYPNVSWTINRGRFVAKALFDIEVGKELTISYGPTMTKEDFITRQNRLLYKYLFLCGCDACLVNSRLFTSVRCRQCSGPVADLWLDNDIHGRSCLKCGTIFEQWETVRDKVKDFQEKFNQMIDKVSKDEDTTYSLFVAEMCLKTLNHLICPTSVSLLQCLLRLVNVYHKLGMADRAVICSDTIEELVDLQMVSGFGRRGIPTLLVDLLLPITDLHMKYLTDNRMSDKRHWDRCFRLYSKLMELLEDVDQYVSQEVCSSASGESSALCDPSVNHMERKQKELEELSKWYHTYIV